MTEEDETQMEIGHVLFIDLVGYSKLLIEEQKERLRQLTDIVLATAQVRASTEEQLVRLPTGDGMALVFRNRSEEPARCALEIAEALQGHPEIPVRMGIHSGPVSEVTDVSGRPNLAGAGINMAQRVMDCGDAGHILVSKHVAEDLEQYRQWQPRLHDLGECEVKHGVRVSVVNLFAGELGNPEVPRKFREGMEEKKSLAAAVPLGRGHWMRIGLAMLGCLLAGLAIFGIISRSGFLARHSATPAPAAPALPEKSIAVLPFENLSKDQENAFFADGVQDQILTDLARVADLKVISRTSVMQYRNITARNSREIGQELGVTHLLEGSVQRALNKVRINAQLIDARSDRHLWAQTYDRDLADVFAIQSDIAATIAEQLRAQLSSSEKAQIGRTPTTDLVAYDLYLRARQLDDQSNNPDAKGSLLRAISLLEEAVRRDPKFMLAYCLMCETHLDLYWGGSDHTETRRELAGAALKRAESIQPDAGEVHWQKGLYAYHGFRDYDRARSELELACRFLPNEARVYTVLGAVDRRTARWRDAEENFKRAVELDPGNGHVLEEAGATFLGMRRYREAKGLYERAFAISPDDPFSNSALGETLFLETGETVAWKKRLETIAGRGTEAARGVAFSLLLCAWSQRDRAGAERALSLIPPEGIVDSVDEAAVPREYCVGRTAKIFGDSAMAQASLSAARTIFQRMTSEQPDYAQAWGYLGLTDAMLGRREAIGEGIRACEILPNTKDSWVGPGWVTNLAMIHAWLGDKDEALKQLEMSASLIAGISYGELKRDADWETLRGDPRFEKIVASLAPRDSR